MGILDEAIKEHLELKRQHGVAENELKQLEDEAFGASERPGAEEAPPDTLAEAPTEFMSQPDLEEGEEERPRSSRPDVADLQEPPPAESEPAAEEPEFAEEPEPPAEEEAPAMEHEAISEPEIASGPTTDEREAIAGQPTEMFDVEAELGGTQAEEPEPADEEEYEEDDDFWDEKRLSDELDEALEAPSEVEDEETPEDEEALFEDAATEAEQPEADEPEPEQPEHLTPSGDEEDVLEETPDFLEEAPEDDRLWFEQKPPKDFDFDD